MEIEEQLKTEYAKFKAEMLRQGAVVSALWKQVWISNLLRAFPKVPVTEEPVVFTITAGTPPTDLENITKELTRLGITVTRFAYDPITNEFRVYGGKDGQ